MKPFAIALAFLLLSTGAHARAQDDDVDARARSGGWMRDGYGIWRRVEGAYHVAYMRRGCHVEEDWDGLNYSAQIRCRPGVKPN